MKRKLTTATVTLDNNLMDISNVDNKPTDPGKCVFFAPKKKSIEEVFIQFINNHFKRPITIIIKQN